MPRGLTTNGRLISLLQHLPVNRAEYEAGADEDGQVVIFRVEDGGQKVRAFWEV